MKPSLGKLDSGKDLSLDVTRLIDTRLLVQSNSGGGKSWLLRRLLEQTSGHVQQIILDTEGEFSTLREKFDYVICAPHGADAIASPHTAALLARRLRETRVSAIIDLYDLKMHERRRFVRLFLEELLDAPKSMWYPALVGIDEAHLYCPEKGEAESLTAVIDLASRGRKRGLCAMLATQRLSKLHKDAAAELLNKLIGRTGLDVDVKRAADELGLSAKDAMPLLRGLEPGEFFCFGPALSKTVSKITVGSIETKHPKSGDRQISAPPAPSDKIRKVLAELGDLPKEAEQEAKTLSELKVENARLKREATLAKKEAPRGPATKIERIEVPIVGQKAVAGLKEAAKQIDKVFLKARTVADAFSEKLEDIEKNQKRIFEAIEKISGATAHQIHKPPVNPAVPVPRPMPHREAGEFALGKCERSILSVLATHGPCDRRKLALLAGYTFSGSFSNSLGALRTAGYLVGSNTQVMQITDAGVSALGPIDPLPTGQALRDYWLGRFGKCERAILQSLFAHPQGLSKDQLCEATGYAFSGSFSNSLGSLRTAGVIVGNNNSVMRASDELLY